MAEHKDHEYEDEAVDQERTDPVWCVVANVAENTVFGEDKESRKGTKHFSPGTKVYCFPPLWGDGYVNVKVIGRHRGSKKYVTMVMPAKHLTNWRSKLVYSPYVTKLLKSHWDGSEKSKRRSAELADWKQTGVCSGFSFVARIGLALNELWQRFLGNR
ncbi:MAG: hypothetical protein K2X93_01090 [Candidatus Obscuribacterales bacterium]|nr:hypothetical protein [Candidatus Obscuribacterales bacterium]